MHETSRRIPAIVVPLAALAAALASPGQDPVVGDQPPPAPERTPVLVEMYTSHNCPNSPAGEDILTRLDRTQPIPGVLVVPLAFHVPYWRSETWSDPFASSANQWRQNQYAARSSSRDVFTPQFVVDGDTSLAGRGEGAIRKAIQKAGKVPKASIRVELRPSLDGDPARSVRLGIDMPGIPSELRGKPAEIMLALIERNLVTDIGGGKNKGAHVEQTGVVRNWMPIGHVNESGDAIFPTEYPVVVDPSWKLSDLYAVIWVQEKPFGPVLAIGVAPLGR